jgi:pyrimidine-nucleoside phosphorylase
MNTEKIGIVSSKLGAGRINVDDKIDYKAGIKITKKTGERIEKNEIIATLYSNKNLNFADLEDEYLKCLNISRTKPSNIIYKKLI